MVLQPNHLHYWRFRDFGSCCSQPCRFVYFDCTLEHWRGWKLARGLCGLPWCVIRLLSFYRLLIPQIEFIPASHQYLLTVLSIWWAIGQLAGSLVSTLI